MEIITYVREGTVSHRDSLGNVEQIKAGDVQAMSAGSGITHAEWNAHDSAAKVFQIWIKPRTPGGLPGWDTKEFPKQDRAGHWVVLASGYNDAEALALHGDARVMGVTLQAAQAITYRLDGRGAYLVPATGKILLDGHTMNAGDGCVIQDQPSLRIEAIEDSEVVLVAIGAGTRIVPHD